MNACRIRIGLVILLPLVAMLTSDAPESRAAPAPPVPVPQTGHVAKINAVALSRDGRFALVGSNDGGASLWDTASGLKIRTFTGHNGFVAAVGLSADGSVALTGGVKSAILWDTRTGKALHTLQLANFCQHAGLSEDGKWVVTRSQPNRLEPGDRGEVALWDGVSGKLVRKIEVRDEIYSVLLSGDGSTVATQVGWESLVGWDTRSGKSSSQSTLAGSSLLTGIARDGRRLLNGLLATDAELLEVATGKVVHKLTGHKGQITSAALNDNGRRIVTGSKDQLAILWDGATGKQLRVFDGHDGPIAAVAISGAGDLVLTGSEDFSAILWDARTGAKLHTLKGEKYPGAHIAFSGDGGLMLARMRGKTATLWDVREGKLLRTLGTEKEYITGVALSGDGLKMAVGIYNNPGLTLWDTKSGAELRTFREGLSSFPQAALSQDGGRLAAATSDLRTVVVWDTATGAKVGSWDPGFCSGLALSADGSRVLLASVTDKVELRDARTGAAVGGPLTDPKQTISDVALSADGRFAVSSSFERKIALWDLGTRKIVRTFQGLEDKAETLTISKNSKLVLAASVKGEVRIWELATGKERAALQWMGAARGWLVTTPEGYADGTVDARNRLAYRLADTRTVLPVDRFVGDYYRPGLLADLLKNEDLPAPPEAAVRKVGPKLRVVSHAAAAVVEDHRVTLEVEATDEGGGIRKPWIKHNGSRVLNDAVAPAQGKVQRYGFPIGLVEGENRLEVFSASADGEWPSEPVCVVLTYQKQLPKPRLHILAVGINDYQHAPLKLTQAVSGAKEIAALFERRHKALYESVHTVVLLDGQATRAGIEQAIARIEGNASPQDVFLVYFAGQAAILKEHRCYLLPVDYQTRAGKKAEMEVVEQGLDWDEFARRVGRVPALKRMVILDACHSGAAVTLVADPARTTASFRRAIEEMHRAQGVFVIGATAANETVAEAKELGYGVLTYALLAGCNAVAKGPLKETPLQPLGDDTVVDVMSWFGYARGHLPALMRSYHQGQQDLQESARGMNYPLLPLQDR